jgi:hypothetical protein
MMDYGARKQVLYMDEKRDRQHDRTKFMEEENCPESADAFRQSARPDALAETQRETGPCQPQKAGEQRGMKIPLRPRKAHEIPLTRWTLLAACYDYRL